MYQQSAPKEIFLKSLISCIIIFGFGIYMLLRSGKQKTDFESVTGQIDYIDQSFQEIKQTDGKTRFIHLVDHPVVFELFIGKDPGDFSPESEQLDSLILGDEITVYFAERTPFQKGEDARINKTVQFIDKEGEAYFTRGNKDKYGGYFFVGMGVMISILLVVLRQMGKII
ncbi:hypothetical protein OB13_09190 [Pontibacter sp. HJ8]